MNKLLKIWKDPVFSKIISGIMIALLTLLYNLICAKIEKSSFEAEFTNFWNYKVELWKTFILLCVFIFMFYLNGIKFKYDEETLRIDRDFFNKFRNEYLTTEAMLAAKTNTFSSNPFEAKHLHAIIGILDENKKADFEFINPHLNTLKNELINEIENFYSVTSRFIFGTHNSGWLSIPTEWEYTQPSRLEEAQRLISKQENILTVRYEKLITKGRRILKV